MTYYDESSTWGKVYVDVDTSDATNWKYTYANDIFKPKKPDMFDNDLFEIEED
jgi:hypothetical protein